jgi:small nuclear ribonucleoprotein (snRNP)-like protein
MNLTKIFLAAFSCIIMLVVPHMADAGAKPTPIEGVSYQVNASMKDNIKTLVGKKVYVHLDSGTTLSGVVKAVGNHLIHLEKLDRKDFFDALIKIDTIIAIDAQFRKYQ